MLAAPVNAEKAAVVARTFWSETLKAKNADELEQQHWQYDAIYLFAVPKGGWVMVAADDCARPVLSYSLWYLRYSTDACGYAELIVCL